MKLGKGVKDRELGIEVIDGMARVNSMAPSSNQGFLLEKPSENT